jgi:predicted kinase
MFVLSSLFCSYKNDISDKKFKIKPNKQTNKQPNTQTNKQTNKQANTNKQTKQNQTAN